MTDNNQNANGSNDIDLHQTAAAFMNSLFSSDRLQDLEEPKLDLDLDKMTSKYDGMSEDQLMGGASKIPEPGSQTFQAPEPSSESSQAPEPGQQELNSNSSEPSSPITKIAPTDDSEMLHDRLDKILSFGFETKLAPEPGSETLSEQSADKNLSSGYETELAPEPGSEKFQEVIEAKAELTDANNNDNNNDLSPTPADKPAENVNDNCAPEPGQVDLKETRETVQISVDYAPNVDQTDTPDIYQEVSNNDTVPEPASATFQPEVVDSAPEPSESTFTAPEPNHSSFAPESEIASIPEPNQNSFVASAPEPTTNGQSKFASEEEEEEDDSFSESFSLKTKRGKKAPWSIPDQPRTNTLDKFGTIRQNISRGNTSKLLSLWEEKKVAK